MFFSFRLQDCTIIFELVKRDKSNHADWGMQKNLFSKLFKTFLSERKWLLLTGWESLLFRAEKAKASAQSISPHKKFFLPNCQKRWKSSNACSRLECAVMKNYYCDLLIKQWNTTQLNPINGVNTIYLVFIRSARTTLTKSTQPLSLSRVHTILMKKFQNILYISKWSTLLISFICVQNV